MTKPAAILASCLCFLVAALSGDEDKRPCVYFFIVPDCPIANAYAPEIEAISKAFASEVAFQLVYTNPDLEETEVAEHRAEYRLTVPAVIDREHELVARFGATITPEAALVSKSGTLLYRGRIDDRFTGFGDRRPEPRERNLRRAIEEVLAGKTVTIPRTEAVGCFIE